MAVMMVKNGFCHSLPMDYAYYTTEDFAADESFQAFVFATDPVAVGFWQRWQQQHPEQAQAMQQATALLHLLAEARPVRVPAATKQQELDRLLMTIREPTHPVARPWQLRGQRARLLRGAVLLTLLLIICAGYWLWAPGSKPRNLVRYATTFGQQRVVTLPDGSVVTLNANSVLETAARWLPDQPREVWLQGEAFFAVAHTAADSVRTIASAPAPAKFQVHASDLDVTVLGTRFNVNSRGEHATVVLSTGKVQLARRAWLQREELLLKPGEMAAYSPRTENLERQPVNPQTYTSWTNGYLTFDHSSVTEIIQVMQQTYGLQVTVTDEALLDQRLTGTLPSNNADVFLQALAKALRLEVSRKGNKVKLSPAND